MDSRLIDALRSSQAAFGLTIADDQIESLARYYDLVQQHNPLLHLVAPCKPEEFATRHILESLTILEFLPHAAKFADVGAGAGLPSIPCLLARDDLRATLIESKIRKATFLQAAISALGITSQATLVNRQFEETTPDDCQYVACRALDKFSEKLPRLLKWARGRPLLLFGGESLGKQLQEAGRKFVQRLMPLSERRYLYAVQV